MHHPAVVFILLFHVIGISAGNCMKMICEREKRGRGERKREGGRERGGGASRHDRNR